MADDNPGKQYAIHKLQLYKDRNKHGYLLKLKATKKHEIYKLHTRQAYYLNDQLHFETRRHATCQATPLIQPQIKGKESENSYQELKRSQKDRHTQTHGNFIEICFDIM